MSEFLTGLRKFTFRTVEWGVSGQDVSGQNVSGQDW